MSMLNKRPHDEPSFEAYSPLNVLKPVARDVWIVDGPEIQFDYAGLRLPFTIRVIVIKLRNGDLLLHSPRHWPP
jgi:hypothetical protein